MADIIMFGILGCVVLAAAIYSVCTKYIMRAATALIVVLFGVAGLYFLLDYTYLGAVQLSIYAGAVSIIYIFAIQLVGRRNLQGHVAQFQGSRVATGIVLTLVGLATVVGILWKNSFFYAAELQGNKEFDMHAFGQALMGAGKYEYVLPFEFISVFLLACIIGGLLVARDNKKEEK